MIPANKIPENARPVLVGLKIIGYVWLDMQPLTSVPRSSLRAAKRYPRYTSMTLAGDIVSRSSQTRREAVKTLKAGIKRKYQGKKVETRYAKR